MLDDALRDALAGKGRSLCLSADAGIGKTRLIHEFVETCSVGGIRTLEARGLAHTCTLPLVPVIELLRCSFEIKPDDDPAVARSRIDQGMREAGVDAADSWLLHELLGVANTDIQYPRLDPEIRRSLLLRFLRALMESQASTRPTVIVLEDVHWFDEASAAWVRAIVENAAHTNTLALLSYRPEEAPAWVSELPSEILDLAPLGAENFQVFLGDLLGTSVELDEVRNQISDRTRGNPFYAEEVVRALAERGTLIGYRGAYRLVRDFDIPVLPETVEAAIVARMDRLPARERTVLQAASVIGGDVDGAVLARMIQLEPAQLESATAELCERTFLVRRSDRETDLAFRHPLTREAAYQTQLRQHRAELHARCAQALVEVSADDTGSAAATVAYHWERGQQPAEAARWHRRAARWVGLSDIGQAERHLAMTCRMLDQLPQSPRADHLSLVARIERLTLAWRTGTTPATATRMFEEALPLAEQSKDASSLALLHFIFGSVRGFQGAVRLGLAHVSRAIEIATDAGISDMLQLILVSDFYLSLAAGDVRNALSSADRALAMAGDDLEIGGGFGTFNPVVYAMVARAGFILPEIGRLAEARRDLDLALVVARERGEVEIDCWGSSTWVRIAECAGDPSGAVDHAERAMGIAAGTRAPYSLVFAHWARGSAARLENRLGDARMSLSRALDIARKHQTCLENEGRILADLAMVSHDLAEFDRAHDEATAGVAAAQRNGTKGWECQAQLGVAAVALAIGELTEAQGALDAARGLSDTNGIAVFGPRISELRGRLAHALGDETSAVALHDLAVSLHLRNGAPERAARLARDGRGT